MIVPETDAHIGAIREVNRMAFGRDDEAVLVDRLRADGAALVSLVAIDGEGVVGHILFSPLELAGVFAAALAPMAVRPEHQRRGIGSAMVRRGIGECGARGVEAIFVVGHPGYYPRFGFSAGLARSIPAPFSGDAFMALELRPGALGRAHGRLRYAAAFGIEV